MGQCPVCGCDVPGDPSVGYHADELCDVCAEAGWIETSERLLVNEQTGEMLADVAFSNSLRRG